MHNPELESDFYQTVCCPTCDHMVEVLFYTCGCCRQADGTCPACEADIEFERTAEYQASVEMVEEAAIDALIESRST